VHIYSAILTAALATDPVYRALLARLHLSDLAQ
jgi:hypothetical protein